MYIPLSIPPPRSSSPLLDNGPVTLARYPLVVLVALIPYLSWQLTEISSKNPLLFDMGIEKIVANALSDYFPC